MAEAGIAHGWIGTDLVVHDRHEDTADALLAAIERRHGLDSDATAEREAGSEVEYDLSEWDSPARAMLTGRLIEADVAFRWEGGLLVATAADEGRVDAVLDAVDDGAGRRRRHPDERGGAGGEPAVGALRRGRRPGWPSQRPRHHPPPERAVRAERGRPGALRRQPVLVGADPRPGVGPARPLARRRGRRRRQGRGARGPRAPPPAGASRASQVARSARRPRTRHDSSRPRSLEWGGPLPCPTCCWPSWRCGTRAPSPPRGGSRSATSCCPSTRHPASAACCSAPSSPPTCGASTSTSCPTSTASSPRSSGASGSCSPASATATRSTATAWPAPPTAWSAGARTSASSSRTTARRCSRCSARCTPPSGSAPDARHAVAGVLHQAMRWNGPIGPSLVTYLAGERGAGQLAVGLRRSGGVGARRPRLRARDRQVRPAGRHGPVPHPPHASAPRPRRRRGRRQQGHRRPRRGPPHPARG